MKRKRKSKKDAQRIERAMQKHKFRKVDGKWHLR